MRTRLRLLLVILLAGAVLSAFAAVPDRLTAQDARSGSLAPARMPTPTWLAAQPDTGPTETGGKQVPVLAYHNLDPHSDGKSAPTISPVEFEAQMAWLDRNGYESITTAELANWLSGTGQLPAKPVLITFDDGYESSLVYADPILKRHGLKATIFPIAVATGQTSGSYPHLSDEQLKEMAASGVWEIQGHSYAGHTLANGKPPMTAWTVAQCRQDLVKMNNAFKADCLPSPLAFAYPYGAWNATLIQTLQATGIRLAFTVEPGYVRQGDNPFTLHRWIIYPHTGTCQFSQVVTGRPGQCGSPMAGGIPYRR